MKISLEWLREYVEIRKLPETLKEKLTLAGLAVESISKINGDVVLEMEVPTNRPDCLSHIGVAREIAALYNLRLKPPPFSKNLLMAREEIEYKVAIRDPELCPRYTGLVLDGIRIAPSPPWMQRRLEAAAMRPVNNVVDITNYVLLEMGHPLHAFDFRRLRKGKIVVARASRGQKIVTLDGVERILDEQMLLINDGEAPVAIAGVMGGLGSEISPDTTTILLECAYFQPASVRRTAKKLGLSSEASYRFERGADWNDTVAAIARTCYLIEQHAGGRIAGGLQDVYPKKKNPVKIVLRRQQAERLLGVKFKDSFIVSTLKRLQFKPVSKGRGTWQVTCPTYRVDMELEADLIEELARFYGYQSIPTTLPTTKNIGTNAKANSYRSAARRILLSLGYHEGINLSFATEDEHRQFSLGEDERITIINPLTEDTQFLRTTLAPGLVKTAKRNFNHDIWHVTFFELGKVYCVDAKGGFQERDSLGILGTGGFGRNWHHRSGDYDFFHLKGAITALLQGMRSAKAQFVPAPEIRWLNPANASLLIVSGERVGVLGSLHPDLEQEYKLKQPLYLAEIDFEKLSAHVFLPVQYEQLPKYPAVERDLSVVLSRDVTYDAIRTGILGLGIAELISIDLVDVYEGEKIPAGKLSLTFRFTFQDPTRTLTVDQVQSFTDNILNFLRSSYAAELR